MCLFLLSDCITKVINQSRFRALRIKCFSSQVRNLKYLAPFSTLANVITIVSFGIICYYIFREPLTLDHREPVGKLQNFPLYFGTVLFALEAIGVVSDFVKQLLYVYHQICCVPVDVTA